MTRTGVWWRPDLLGWWTGVLFALGSLLFLVPGVAALGSSAPWIGVGFASGAVCFTAAAALQLLAASEAPHRALGREPPLRPRAWMPARIDWIAAAVQFPGTLLFNVNTLDALNRALSADQADVRVWSPDVVGSACFLVSAGLAFANTEHAWLSWRPRDREWQLAAANLTGAVAFGVSAVAAYVRPDSGSALSDAVANGATAVGALGFFVGAVLLLAQSARS